MKVLFDIVHPADVLLFYHPMRILKEHGHEIMVVSREKDVAIDLLDRFGIAHQPISIARKGPFALGTELLTRDFALWKIARRFRPDVMTGFGGVAPSHVGKLLKIPSVIFYDTETATLQTRITYPFVTELHVPKWYSGPVPAGRTRRFNGFKELSYFHPNRFRPDRETAIRNGLDPKSDNFFIRIVSWTANHDIGKSGWSHELLAEVVARLSALGKVHISSETALPDKFAPHLYAGIVTEVHHVLALCRLYVGESATMCTESAVLGVPGVFSAPYDLSYLRKLASTGMIANLGEVDKDQIITAIENILSRPRKEWRTVHQKMLSELDDTALYIVSTLESWEAKGIGINK